MLSVVFSASDRSRLAARYNRLMRAWNLPEIREATELLSASLRWPMEGKDDLASLLWEACELPPVEQFLKQERPYFSWEGIEEWLARGHSIGLHTRTHPDCSRLGEDGINREIVGPAALLRERFGVSAIPFSYPFGWRAAAATEQVLVNRGVVDCALGIEGFAPFGTAPHALERACIEQDLTFNAFGRPLLGLPRQATRNRQPRPPARRIRANGRHAGQSGVERSETAL
jgi:Polysaccharide deacetylase